jgi:outer membrane protein OmpA-like peptidoglycan-associated protein
MALVSVSALGLAGVAAPSQAEPVTQVATGPAFHQYVVFFRDGEAGLTPDGQQIVQRIADAAKQLHPGKIEVIGSNDGLATTRENVADARAAAVAHSLEQAGIKSTAIARAGSAKPAGAGIAAHQVIVRFEQPEAMGEVADAE